MRKSSCTMNSRSLFMQRFLQIGTNAANAEIPSNWDKCGNASGFCGPVTHDASSVFWCRVSSAESFKIFRQLGIIFLVGSRTRTWLFTSCVYHRAGSTIARHGQCVYSKVASEHLFGFSEICSGSTFDWNYTAQ